MHRRFAAGLALACACLPAAAQIPAPDTWRKESFSFPLPFAPSIPYEGREHVRFSPEWTRFATEEGFSYVVLWDIKATPMEPAVLERALGVYFDGLMNNVAEARKLKLMVPQSQAVLHPMAAPAGWKDAAAGEVHTWNAFHDGEDLVLHAEIAWRPCGAASMQLFYAFAKAPRSAAVWQRLRGLREATACGSR